MEVPRGGFLYSSQLGGVGGQEVKALGGSLRVRPGTWEDADPGNQLGEKEAADVLNVRSHRTSRQGGPVGKQDGVGLGLRAIGGREELSRRQAIVKECVEVGEPALSLRE